MNNTCGFYVADQQSNPYHLLDCFCHENNQYDIVLNGQNIQVDLLKCIKDFLENSCSKLNTTDLVTTSVIAITEMSLLFFCFLLCIIYPVLDPVLERCVSCISECLRNCIDWIGDYLRNCIDWIGNCLRNCIGCIRDCLRNCIDCIRNCMNECVSRTTICCTVFISDCKATIFSLNRRREEKPILEENKNIAVEFSDYTAIPR